MTAIQSFKIYELLQSYSIAKDKAKLMIAEIEQIVSTIIGTVLILPIIYKFFLNK